MMAVLAKWKTTDNDHKVVALQTLEQELHANQGQDVDIASLESIASLLKISLRNGNSRVYAAGLSCTLAYFKVADKQWQEAHQSGQHIHQLESIFKNAVTTLALPPGGLLTFLGDAKDSVRTTARSALLQSAKTAAAISSSSNSRLPPDQQPLVLLDKAIKEHGFASKSGKIREQVGGHFCSFND